MRGWRPIRPPTPPSLSPSPRSRSSWRRLPRTSVQATYLRKKKYVEELERELEAMPGGPPPQQWGQQEPGKVYSAAPKYVEELEMSREWRGLKNQSMTSESSFQATRTRTTNTHTRANSYENRRERDEHKELTREHTRTGRNITQQRSTQQGWEQVTHHPRTRKLRTRKLAHTHTRRRQFGSSHAQSSLAAHG